MSNTQAPHNEIIKWSAKELSKQIHQKKVSCREVLSAYLAQVDKVNPTLNAIVSRPDSEKLLAQADEKDALLAKGESMGWMHGFPMAPKDLSNTKEITTTQGSLALKDNLPAADGLMVERMRKSGAIFIGKTNTPEFGFGSQTYNKVFGVTRNAYDPSKIAGGSSGGAAVALASHMLPVADGSDMMGSLRNPAAYNNIFGFRPSQGRVPIYPSADVFTQQLGYEGPMGRNVEDLAMLLSIQAGWDARTPLAIYEDPAKFTEPLQMDLKGKKIGWLGDWEGYLAMEDGILDLCHQALSTLGSQGCEIEHTRPDYSPYKIWDTWLILRQFQSATNLRPLYDQPAKRELLKPEVIWEVENGLRRSNQEIGQAMNDRTALYQASLSLFEKYDYLAVPSAQCFPYDAEIHWPKEVAGRPMDTYHRWMEIVIFASLLGCPVISVPVGFSKEGLPMGMQIIGRPHQDLSVLQIAHEYDQISQWGEKHKSPFGV